MELTKDWEELLKLLPKVRSGWVPEPHEHMEMGCRCLSCNETVGWEMGNDLYTTYCDETETERPLYDKDQCYQQLFSYEEARVVELLLKNRAKLGDLIKWYIQEEKRIVLGNSIG